MLLQDSSSADQEAKGRVLSGKTSKSAAQAGSDELDLLGRDEMNLAEFPIAALTDYVRKGQNTIRFSDGVGSLLITGSDAFGLPTATDADVVVALIQLTKRRNQFGHETVHFTRAELLEILGWAESGKSYRRLTESLIRWSTTSLKYEGTWWDLKSRRKINAIFHILNEVVLYDRVGSAGGGPGSQPLSHFTWNRIFLESCQAGNLKRLDLKMYFALEHASSKRLYRFLDKRLHRQPDQAFDLAEVAFERIGLSRSYVGKKGGVNIAKVREKLQPAIDELIARGFLRPLGPEERYQKQGKDWMVRFSRTAKPPIPAEEEVEAGPTAWAADSATSLGSAAEAPVPTIDAGALAEELIRRGVSRSRSESLVRRFSGAVIAEKIEVFDWRLAKDPRSLKLNPAGWLIKAIEDDYPIPSGFETKASRESRLELERSTAEASRQKRDESRRRDRDREAISAHLAGLEPAQLAALQAEALASATEESRREYESPTMNPSLRKALLNVLVREFVGERLRRGAPSLF